MTLAGTPNVLSSPNREIRTDVELNIIRQQRILSYVQMTINSSRKAVNSLLVLKENKICLMVSCFLFVAFFHSKFGRLATAIASLCFSHFAYLLSTRHRQKKEMLSMPEVTLPNDILPECRILRTCSAISSVADEVNQWSRSITESSRRANGSEFSPLSVTSRRGNGNFSGPLMSSTSIVSSEEISQSAPIRQRGFLQSLTAKRGKHGDGKVNVGVKKRLSPAFQVTSGEESLDKPLSLMLKPESPNLNSAVGPSRHDKNYTFEGTSPPSPFSTQRRKRWSVSSLLGKTRNEIMASSDRPKTKVRETLPSKLAYSSPPHVTHSLKLTKSSLCLSKSPVNGPEVHTIKLPPPIKVEVSSVEERNKEEESSSHGSGVESRILGSILLIVVLLFLPFGVSSSLLATLICFFLVVWLKLVGGSGADVSRKERKFASKGSPVIPGSAGRPVSSRSPTIAQILQHSQYTDPKTQALMEGLLMRSG